ncbi:hypothetical protein BDR07DRAFT_1372705 [Suillus spraguei]|nr:hypothetical protein BDR07DRAFT_1372705 [Suillus spraguei]
MSSRENQADILAKKHFGHEVFDMCWNTDADEVLMVETPTKHHQPNHTLEAKPHHWWQANMTLGYKADFDMCWGICHLAEMVLKVVPLLHQPPIRSIQSGAVADPKESSESQAFHNMCFDNDSLAASPAPRDDSLSQIVYASEELLRQSQNATRKN